MDCRRIKSKIKTIYCITRYYHIKCFTTVWLIKCLRKWTTRLLNRFLSDQQSNYSLRKPWNFGYSKQNQRLHRSSQSRGVLDEKSGWSERGVNGTGSQRWKVITPNCCEVLGIQHAASRSEPGINGYPRPRLVPKNFRTVSVTSNFSTHAWSIKCS